MTSQRQRYLEDSYLFEVVTTVIESWPTDNGVALVLADNIFHPAGGGQPDDQGEIDGHAVTAIVKGANGSVYVDVEASGAGYAEGESVAARIDPGVRRLNSALHTAGHLIDSVLRQQDFLEHRASNHRPGQARVEYAISHEPHPEAIEELRAELPEAVNALIAAALPVVTGVSATGARIVSIGDHADPCGGTHVAHTGELAGFAVRSLKKKSGLLKAGYSVEHAGL